MQSIGDSLLTNMLTSHTNMGVSFVMENSAWNSMIWGYPYVRTIHMLRNDFTRLCHLFNNVNIPKLQVWPIPMDPSPREIMGPQIWSSWKNVGITRKVDGHASVEAAGKCGNSDFDLFRMFLAMVMPCSTWNVGGIDPAEACPQSLWRGTGANFILCTQFWPMKYVFCRVKE